MWIETTNILKALVLLFWCFSDQIAVGISFLVWFRGKKFCIKILFTLILPFFFQHEG